MIRRGMSILMAAGVAVTPIVMAAPAQAAVTCSGFNCDGKDPQATHCADGATTSRTTYVRNSAGTAIAKVELRWSPTCKTNWSRVTAVGSTTRRMQGDVFRWSDHADRVGGIVTAPSVWSAMLYAPGVCADAGGRVFFSDGKTAYAVTAVACG